MERLGHYNLRTSDQLQTFVDYTKHLHIFLLGRLEQFLEAGQLEEQHGFQPGRRLEEHLITANLVLDRADAVGIRVWIISLDLSKAFDGVHWPAFWTALVDEGIPVHLVWILQCINFGQCGEVVGDLGHSSKFNITGCVRQGCVLSPNGRCDNGGQCRKCRFQPDGQRS